MSALTLKQEKFAQCIADGMTQADAYRTAFDAKRMTDNSIYREASLLLDNPKIAQRVDDLRNKLASKSLWTREMSVKALVQAYKEGNASAKVAAVKELNLMHGFNAPQKLELTNPDGTMAPTQIIITAKNADSED
jgi:phage terminase small subunit